MICVGVLVAAAGLGCGSDDDADVSQPSASTVAAEPIAPTDSGSPTTAVPTTVAAVETLQMTKINVSPVPVSAPFTDVDVGDGQIEVQRLVPWKGGFLAIGTISEGQPLPGELPADVAALFPQEVLDVFPDGLPPTLDEATATLEEAGLYEVVYDIVSANPDAYDSIFSITPQSPVVVFSWSEDGDVWKPIDSSVPEAIDHIAFDVAGDRLVAWGSSPIADPLGAADANVIASTSDLVDWTVDVIEVELPASPPDAVRPVTATHSLLANESGWVLERAVFLDFAPEDLVTPESVGVPEDATLEVTGVLDDGVRVRVLSDPDSDELTVSWHELGFDDALQPYLAPWGWGPPMVTELWASSWDAEPVLAGPDVAATFPGSSGFGSPPVTATADGYLRFGAISWFSADGLDWSRLTNNELVSTEMPWTGFAVPVPDGVVVVETDRDGEQRAFRVDTTGQDWLPIDVPGLPADLTNTVWGAGDLPFSPWIVDVSPRGLNQTAEAPPDQWLVTTADGEKWLVEDLEDGNLDDWQPYVAGLNGTTVLVGKGAAPDDWLRYELD